MQQRAVMRSHLVHIAVHVTVGGAEECATLAKTHTDSWHLTWTHKLVIHRQHLRFHQLYCRRWRTESHVLGLSLRGLQTQGLSVIPRLPLVTAYAAVSPAGDLITPVHLGLILFKPHLPSFSFLLPLGGLWMTSSPQTQRKCEFKKRGAAGRTRSPHQFNILLVGHWEQSMILYWFGNVSRPCECLL